MNDTWRTLCHVLVPDINTVSRYPSHDETATKIHRVTDCIWKQSQLYSCLKTMASALAAYMVWFGFLRNGNIHTSLIEGWRYRINYTDVFSRKESHLTRSVHAILGGQGSFSQHFYKCMCMKIICRQPGDMDTALCLPHCLSSSFIPMFSAPPPALW